MIVIHSGGQSGADRAGLDAAHALGYPTGGWAPKGWRIENLDGSDSTDPSLAALGLKEHSSREYPPRTRQNAQETDGTVWFGNQYSKGGRLTIRSAKDAGKPYTINPSAQELADWIKNNGIRVLNVAGNRARFNPEIYERVFEVMTKTLEILRQKN